jgi:cardiolipin synthase
LGRDVWILAGAALAFVVMGRRDFPPSGLGKASTAVQIVTVAAVLVANAAPIPALAVAASWLYYATGIMAVLSGGHYTWRMIRPGPS